MNERRLRGDVVTFDKGGRVPRLTDGIRLDARQVGILLAQAKADPDAAEGERDLSVRWVEPVDDNAVVPERLRLMLERKGPHDPQVLLLALGMDALRAFEVRRGDGARFVLEGTRATGFVARDA